MGVVALIACVGKKKNIAARAEELYESALFTYALAYAKSLEPDDIFILSAKYGLVQKDTVKAPYDETLNAMSKKERLLWAQRVLADLDAATNLESDHYVILAGRRYREYLIPRMKSYEVPLEGLGIGQQLHWLKRQVGP